MKEGKQELGDGEEEEMEMLLWLLFVCQALWVAFFLLLQALRVAGGKRRRKEKVHREIFFPSLSPSAQ